MSNIPPVILSTAGYKHSHYLLVSCEPSSLFPSWALFPALCIVLYSLYILLYSSLQSGLGWVE